MSIPGNSCCTRIIDLVYKFNRPKFNMNLLNAITIALLYVLCVNGRLVGSNTRNGQQVICGDLHLCAHDLCFCITFQNKNAIRGYCRTATMSPYDLLFEAIKAHKHQISENLCFCMTVLIANSDRIVFPGFVIYFFYFNHWVNMT